jgi:small-conductance mechanosensitive channel
MIEFVGPNSALQIFGVKLVGVHAENGRKLLFTVLFIILVYLLGRFLHALAARTMGRMRNRRIEFWTRQAIRLTTAVVMLVGILSVWFDDPTRLATALGLVTAGLAFALQRVVTAIAAYFVILRGQTFNVGDRITMAGVRGDVIALNFTQTTIMEMGQPPGEQGDSPSMWVKARQYTGRIVTVTNDKIFQEPVYNYSRDFPFIWEEMQIPVAYKDDRVRAEQILLEAAAHYTMKIGELGEDSVRELERRYFITRAQMEPRVFWRLTDNWIEMSVRFICQTHGVRDVKDRMSRRILEEFDAAKISLPSATFELVGVPPIRIENAPSLEYTPND